MIRRLAVGVGGVGLVSRRGYRKWGKMDERENENENENTLNDCLK